MQKKKPTSKAGKEKNKERNMPPCFFNEYWQLDSPAAGKTP